ncbi:MAG: hypothetical protein WA739_03790, partial [Candidatus Acidiferrales bacterium]
MSHDRRGKSKPISRCGEGIASAIYKPNVLGYQEFLPRFKGFCIGITQSILWAVSIDIACRDADSH